MSQLSSIRTKLYSLVPLTVLALGIAVGVGLYVQARYSIGGPIDNQISVLEEFRSELEPAQFTPAQAMLILQELETERRPDAVAKLTEAFREFERNFDTARANRLNTLRDGEARRLLDRDLSDAGSKLFSLVNTRYLPLVERASRGEPVDQAEVSKALREVMAQYRAVRVFSFQVLRVVDQDIQAERAQAAASAAWWGTTNLVVSCLALAFLVGIKYLVARSIVRSTDRLNERVRELASGASDLTARVPVTSRDELGVLAESINGMVGKIQGIIGKVRESSLQVLSVASEIAATSRGQEETVNTLASSTTQVAASVREISATSKDLSGTMNEVNQSAAQAASLANAGRENTTHMAEEMKQLVESTASVSSRLGMIREKADNINAVVTTITKVADQTNLLSINAAIEAEKAGEYGRGFLVVAREIRRLADQTAVATLDIETMVKQMQDAVSAGVMQMDKFADEVRSGVAQVNKINQMTYEIITEVQGLSGRFQLVNEGMRNQATGAQQINDAMGQIADAARKTAQAVKDFEQATGHLRGSVEGLNQEISQFKI